MARREFTTLGPSEKWAFFKTLWSLKNLQLSKETDHELPSPSSSESDEKTWHLSIFSDANESIVRGRLHHYLAGTEAIDHPRNDKVLYEEVYISKKKQQFSLKKWNLEKHQQTETMEKSTNVQNITKPRTYQKSCQKSWKSQRMSCKLANANFGLYKGWSASGLAAWLSWSPKQAACFVRSKGKGFS